jgi:hypothetical protein
MIVNELYNGSGLGNQLWRYTVTRAIALDNGYEFGIMNPHKFKALKIFDLDFGKEVIGGSGPEGGPPIALPRGIERYYEEQSLIHPVFQCDCRLYDPNLASVPDNTKIDGNMESEKYLDGKKELVREWLRVKQDKRIESLAKSDVCILNIRGGEYSSIGDLFLPKTYWQSAMNVMLSREPKMKFAIVTDDPRTTRRMFPELKSHHYTPEVDWLLIRNTKNIIMSNSSFAWMATWINENLENVIAPKYWGKHNVSDGFWAQGDSLTKGWEYLDKHGVLFDYEECKKEKDEYESKHSDTIYKNYKESV